MNQKLPLDEIIGKACMNAVHDARSKCLESNKDGAIIDVEAWKRGGQIGFDIDEFNAGVFPIWDKLVLKILCFCGMGREDDPAIRAEWDALSQVEKIAYGAGFAFSYKNFVQCVLNAAFFNSWRKTQGRPNLPAAN